MISLNAHCQAHEWWCHFLCSSLPFGASHTAQKKWEATAGDSDATLAHMNAHRVMHSLSLQLGEGSLNLLQVRGTLNQPIRHGWPVTGALSSLGTHGGLKKSHKSRWGENGVPLLGRNGRSFQPHPALYAAVTTDGDATYQRTPLTLCTDNPPPLGTTEVISLSCNIKGLRYGSQFLWIDRKSHTKVICLRQRS